MEKQKRERSSNFTQDETDLLISLVEERKHIIENKKSDATTWQEKKEAWKDIERAFNGSVFRDHKHLKLKYEAIKRDTRKRFRTSDGMTIPFRLTNTEERVKRIILPSVDGNDNQFESDFSLPNPNNIKPKEDNTFVDINMEDENLEMAKIQKEIMTEALVQKIIQRKLLEKELEHKETLYELEKQHLLMKIEILKKELGET
ncbi:myb/SANT-like DNA-binding domain-containing protein 4 [Colias croceus]|uniref:myb/SANT-like DNA-binding domain-containing protein 4 n=1 Tax=Colias crocea TaxID=72248 RepID=UPI001E281619|nr:myb/SANT-like DNA-binding domain-containing protein 4 [Colias croceus]